jgi:hypothetical protein
MSFARSHAMQAIGFADKFVGHHVEAPTERDGVVHEMIEAVREKVLSHGPT